MGVLHPDGKVTLFDLIKLSSAFSMLLGCTLGSGMNGKHSMSLGLGMFPGTMQMMGILHLDLLGCISG